MYNFVFYFKNEDLFRNISQDIIDRPDVKLIFRLPYKWKRLLSLIHRVVFSDRLKILYVAEISRNFWNSLYFEDQFRDKKPICFLFDRNMDYYFRKTRYYEYLRKAYPGCKLVFVFHDRVEGTARPYTKADRDYLATTFDVIFVYSLFDAKKYGFKFFPAYESRIIVSPKKEYSHVDLFYAGEAKDRTELIQRVCKKANAAGLKCYFYIRGARHDEQLPMEGIIYSDRYMPFIELVERAASAKGSLDILQGNAAGFTSRLWHAIFYNKFLLTNNDIVKYTKYYNNKYMKIIDEEVDIDFSFIKNTDAPDYKYENEFSPVCFLEYLEKVLEANIEPEEYYGDWFDIDGYYKGLMDKVCDKGRIIKVGNCDENA